MKGAYVNTGTDPTLQPVDIGHPVYVGLIDPDTAFWSLVKKEKLAGCLAGGALLSAFREKRESFSTEMEKLRFGLRPSAVYFNPTDRCNLNCSYCYIPEELRRSGTHLSEPRLLEALEILRTYFRKTLPPGRLPQLVFHGAEPMLNRQAVFAGIERYGNDFRFGIQTNATLLDEAGIDFLSSHKVALGLSLDGHVAEIADRTRRTWSGKGVLSSVVSVLERLKGTTDYSVLCTVTRENLHALGDIVRFFHELEIPICMLNPVRCTRPGARELKPADDEMAVHYFRALDLTVELYEKTGRKLVVANFANILVSLLAPAARRLMCDISPCGGGRAFFAVSARGDLFPCSEFIGMPEFCGGNLFTDGVEKALESSPFRQVTHRIIEEIEPCARCAVRHFCGSPCPAEPLSAGQPRSRGAFCELYEQQVRYALRQIADGREEAYLWDHWDAGTVTTLEVTAL